MKKIAKIMLATFCVIALLFSCNDQSTSSTKTKKFKIGIAQSIEHTSLTQIREAIMQKLKELGYNEQNADIDYQNANGDKATLSSICSKFQGDKKDLVIAVGTTTAQAMYGSVNNAPILFSAVTDPVGAKLVTSYKDTSKNITGVANAFPLKDIFQLSAQLTPDIKKIGFIHCSSELGAGNIIENTKAVLAKDYPAMQTKEYTFSSSSELQQTVESMVGEVDAIFVPNDSVIAASMPMLSEIARKNKIPVYVTADSLVYDGGLATVGMNYSELGFLTAEMADKILKGTAVSKLPVQDIQKFRTVINQTTADRIGITIAQDKFPNAEIVTDKK